MSDLDDRHTPYNIRIDFVYAELIEETHNEVRRHFESLVKATGALAEVQVLASICLRVARLAVAARLLADKGLTEECHLPFRSAAEGIANLLYIIEVGPEKEGRSSTDLARQFLAYGDIAYYKMLTKRPAQSRRAFKRHYGWSDDQVNSFLAEKERLKDKALALGCQNTRWNKKDFATIASLVSKADIPYLDAHFADLTFESFVSSNSATHGDALSLRSQYKALGNEPLEMVFSKASNYADATGWLTVTGWYCMAHYYHQQDWLHELLNVQVRDLLKQRLAKAKEKAHTRIILLPHLEDRA